MTFIKGQKSHNIKIVEGVRVTFHPLYRAWQSMKTRCYRKAGEDWPRYGGRGIYVCKEWIIDFEQFVKDMGPKPSAKHSLDRINNDGPYSKENCRWATWREQNLNKPKYTHCFKGHEFTESNTRHKKHNTGRIQRLCIICFREADKMAARAYRKRQKELKLGNYIFT